jgi:RNA polymerase sigma factor (sigma-70 family)
MPASASADLEARALGGDPEAWNALIRRHNRRVIVCLLARGLTIDRARDVAQEAWAYLIQQQSEGRLTQLSLPGLAVTQARLLAMSQERQSKRQAASNAEQAGAAAAPPSVEERLLGAEQVARVQAELAACSTSARRVFLLVYENPELSHAEAAKRVGLSVQRVRQILCEVRKRLRAAAQGEP